MSEPYANFAERLAQGLQGMQAQFNSLLTMAQPALDGLRQFQVRYGEQVERISRDVTSAAARFAEHMQRLPDLHREAYQTLAAHGWYIDPELPATALENLARQLKADAPAAHAGLCRYYEENLEAIERRLRRKMHNRAVLLSAACAAHRRKEYILSVPVLLAQADGYCIERTGKQLYSRKKGGLKAAFRAGKDAFRKAKLSPLLEKTPLNGHTSEYGDNLDVLNRHAILHGLRTDYGTQLNSCRCLSLLLFLTWVLGERRKRRKRAPAAKTE